MAKGEDVDALTEKVNTHIDSDEIHVTAEDKENWNGKWSISGQNNTTVQMSQTQKPHK